MLKLLDYARSMKKLSFHLKNSYFEKNEGLKGILMVNKVSLEKQILKN